MKTAIRLFVLLTMFLTFNACVYINTKTPYDRDLNLTELGTKKGTADLHSVLWYLVSWGDASYAAAAKNGDIKVMKHADQQVHQILMGLYTRWTVVVYGD